MAQFRFIATNPDELNLGAPSGRILTFPFDYAGVEGLPEVSDFYPIQLSLDDAIHWYWKIRVIRMELTVTHSAETEEDPRVLPASVTLAVESTRQLMLTGEVDGVPILDGEEMELVGPGVSAADTYASPARPHSFLYYGEFTQGDPDPHLFARLGVSMFGKRNATFEGPEIDHMKWQSDSTGDGDGLVIMPSLNLEFFSDIYDGLLFYSVYNSPVLTDGSPTMAFTASFLAAEGGGDITLYLATAAMNLSRITSITCVITVEEIFSWAP